MNVATKSLPENIYAIIVIITIILAYFFIVGQTLVSYSIDTIQTNGPNLGLLASNKNIDIELKENNNKKEIEEKTLYHESKSGFDIDVYTNNNAAIIEAHNPSKVAYKDSLPVNKNAKENNVSQSKVPKSISTDAAIKLIRYISNIFSIIAIIAVGSYFTEKRILKENIRF